MTHFEDIKCPVDIAADNAGSSTVLRESKFRSTKWGQLLSTEGLNERRGMSGCWREIPFSTANCALQSSELMENDTSWHGTSLSPWIGVIVHEDMFPFTPRAFVTESCKTVIVLPLSKSA